MQDKIEEKQAKKPTFLQVVGSVVSAMFGVQSEKARERDFQQGNPMAFILVGIGFVMLFVFTLWVIVKIILSFFT